MKLSISNIAWTTDNDAYIYDIMQELGYSGLEIAPTRIFPTEPYDKLKEAKTWENSLSNTYNFTIPSIQSIWFGRQEKLFGSNEERKLLLDYTKKAIDFASAIKCKNLVFGSPQNRYLPDNVDKKIALDFFKEIGDYAYTKNTAIGMEANPPLYNTNYINTTQEAIDLVKLVNSNGFKVNLDIGTMIENKEDLNILSGNISYINHIHISEPNLNIIEKRNLHNKLADLLKVEEYNNFISIEMKKQDDISKLKETMLYVKEIFYDL